MTFAVLRALHAIIGDALDDIERVYAAANTANDTPVATTVTPLSSSDPLPKTVFPTASYASPPPSPSVSSHTPSTTAPLDFPALDSPYDPTSPAEVLTSHPDVVVAINRIVAAAGQMEAIVQAPFLSVCDAVMGYHLPSCMRLLEASHTVEILREAGPTGLHVRYISERNGVEKNKLAHILRLLCTHHILRELSPDVFTINRISSLVDSHKSFLALKEYEVCGRPEKKYEDTDGIAAFVGLCTDELQKSSAYLTEAYLLSPSRHTREAREPTRAPFCFAFGCAGEGAGHAKDKGIVQTKDGVGFFAWLEGEGFGHRYNQGSVEVGPGAVFPPAPGIAIGDGENANRFRLERFGKAMSGTGSWEAPGAVLQGFDWRSLPCGSIVVDVGGGIGSTSMLLANALGNGSSEGGEAEGLGLKFVIQDRDVVVQMGERAWREKRPELLDSGIAQFQVHDFFTAQPIKNAAIFLLRVILHDWPDVFAQRILLRLREAATDETKLVIADFVLPLACVDDNAEGGLEGVDGADSKLAPEPLLPNLGKANANAYWMDLTMQVTFNGQERTLREIVSLALSAGWKVVKVTKAVGSLFGHIVAVPVPVPMQRRARAGSGSAFFEVGVKAGMGRSSGAEGVDDADHMSAREIEMLERAGSRCGTPTFGSRMELPSVEESMARFGGGIVRSRLPVGVMGKVNATPGAPRPGILKQPVVLTPPVKKKKPSPLSVPPPLSSSPVPAPHYPLASPRHSQLPSPITRRKSHAHLYRPDSQPGIPPVPMPIPIVRQPPPSPMSPRHPHPSLSRRSSYAQLSQTAQAQPSSIPIRLPQEPPSPLVPRQPPSSPIASRHQPIARRLSYAQLPQSGLRKRSGSIIGPPITGGIGGGIGMGSLLLGGGGAGGVLNFEATERNKTSPAHAHGPGVGSPSPGGTVLAAAARIERGTPKPVSP